MITLNHTELDRPYRVKSVGDLSSKDRIMELGFTPNTTVSAVLDGMSDNIRAYRVLGSVIALRNADTRYISVEDV